LTAQKTLFKVFIRVRPNLDQFPDNESKEPAKIDENMINCVFPDKVYFFFHRRQNYDISKRKINFWGLFQKPTQKNSLILIIFSAKRIHKFNFCIFSQKNCDKYESWKFSRKLPNQLSTVLWTGWTERSSHMVKLTF